MGGHGRAFRPWPFVLRPHGRMPLPSRFLVAAGALSLGTAFIGCSHEHGPLADKPDTTSVGNAGRFAPSMVSTTEGLVWAPASRVRFPELQGVFSPLTTQVQPPLTLLGTRADWGFGQTFGPDTGRAFSTWISGPNLPVEPWNRALEASPEGGGENHGGEGHGGAKAHKANL